MPHTKKQLILEYAAKHQLERAGASDLRAIQADLRRQLGGKGNTSISYVASVLRQAGVRVEMDDRFADPAIPEAYAGRVHGLLQFHDFESAECALRRLHQLFCEYRAASDRMGTDLVRSLIVKGKLRAESLANNPRVSTEKRREKEEIAHWFKVWLDLPDAFFDWLELRRQSPEFLQKFPCP